MKKVVLKTLVGLGFSLMLLLVTARGANAQWKVSSEDGKSFIKLGFLFQGQVEFADNYTSPTRGILLKHQEAQNLYIRRFRILGGGNITDKLSFFFETDSPNLGKYDAATGKKVEGNVYMQDIFMTYSFREEFKIDAGMLLVPLSHNSGQSAATLLPVDYGPYSFLSSAPTQSRVGRDYGVMARGYIAQHFEYRLGVFQGIKDIDAPDKRAAAPLRYMGRLVWYPMDIDTGFFYAGTTHGAKKVLAIGISADVQNDYKAYGGDIYYDAPLGNGDVLTLQVDYIYYDGGKDFATLYAQNDWLCEIGYYSKTTKLGFFSQIGVQDFVKRKFGDENRYQVGLAYWGLGHRNNLKLGYTWIVKKQPGLHNDEVYRDMYTLQWQVFMF